MRAIRKFMFVFILSLSAFVLSSCGEQSKFDDMSVTMTPIYESKDEIYFNVHFIENDQLIEPAYPNVALLDKTTKQLTQLSDRNVISKDFLINYLSTTVLTEGFELNTPIFYSTVRDSFIDIRTNKEVEIIEECKSIMRTRNDCNLLDNDLQILLNEVSNGSYEIKISNYLTHESLGTFSFDTDDTISKMYPRIFTYNKYDENKVGIKINFYDRVFDYENIDSEFNNKDYVESVIIEYTIDTNSFDLLIQGSEYEFFDFYKTNNHYVFGQFNKIYVYDIENGNLTSERNNNVSYRLVNGYWISSDTEAPEIFRIDHEFNTHNNLNVEIGGAPAFIFLNDWYFEYTMKDYFVHNGVTYGIIDSFEIQDGITGEIILDISSTDENFMKEYYNDTK